MVNINIFVVPIKVSLTPQNLALLVGVRVER